MRNWRFTAVVIILVVLLDFYIFQAVKTVSQGASARWRTIIFNGYWALTIISLLLFALLPMLSDPYWHRVRTYVFATILGFFFAKLLAALFFLIDDIRRLIQWASGKLFFPNTEGENISEDGISRSVFLSWLGLGMGGALFSSLVYGFGNKYSYKIRRLSLAFDNLPPAFKGLKIIQLSDIHSGSLADQQAVAHGVDLVLAEKADLILFTGDLVNDTAVEMEPYKEIFSRLKAPMGVFSTLGNHDYGDYIWWETPELKKANLDRLKKLQTDMGWRLLMNEHVALEKDGQHIALIGIENWSAKARFPKHGRLNEAYAGAEKYPFKILMSHDPSHWDAQVRPHFPDIDLALAGHTHGMQFGVEIPGLKWSPVQYVYKQWAGLYEEGRQKLYVNRGFGFIGYPGRVGILPEITVIQLT
ncbi:metallophosphoesterase [Flavitalea sp. BT771]|uniref:metallophosphoesterase n=1 Tax=Flavitalea sp. BT771 TaxID=3063329 RepID=UPI0026E1B079|nr:metallophosphoesterase [Flavitalea sp. BT771]MDO6431328.1 metallophosphoesterase [Flavitalea sp. BT771]MDV6220236.1 metallophosphoesterase [Flavitalea sp. BT771]